MKKQLLFVCTGNTCRSPLAKVFTQTRLAQSGIEDWGVDSAGLAVMAPSPASSHAVTVAWEYGSDLSLHRSRQLTADMLDCADLVLVMTTHQKSLLMQKLPRMLEKIYTLGEFAGRPGDISDPFGGSLERYRQTAGELLELTRLVVEKIEKEAD
ncbi:MAG: low molecular weight protein arginine phosphatase [Clostridiales bacterium]|jgi:protein-tyrosine-phosphatase|nr:low molecular weight protein arginine phosphatase [Clostridiales bacterium]